ncbi:MAG: class I SAM-dependent methyltransferase [Pseudomonadota bacterium]
MYEIDVHGHLRPNPLFHRPIDKLHSRCVEYPFAASRLGDAKTILDVGTIKSDPVWIDWLESLPVKVHATDYDAPLKPFKNITFHQADIRRLPLPDGFFDKVIAVSVVEHVGLEAPQVFADTIPGVSDDGDLEAVTELTRVLKPGGELIMTVPFGVQDGLILGNQARNYTIDSIRRFEQVLDLFHIEYYEYQAKNLQLNKRHYGIRMKIFKKLVAPFFIKSPLWQNDDFAGEATWRNIPLALTKAIHRIHLEGVVCGIWKKKKP